MLSAVSKVFLSVLAEFIMVGLTLLAEMFPDVADHAQRRWWNEGNREYSQETLEMSIKYNALL